MPTEITIPPLIYLREAGRSLELCIKPYDGCLQTHTLTNEQIAQFDAKTSDCLRTRILDVKV